MFQKKYKHYQPRFSFSRFLFRIFATLEIIFISQILLDPIGIFGNKSQILIGNLLDSLNFHLD